jgi:hypothetical protein
MEDSLALKKKGRMAGTVNSSLGIFVSSRCALSNESSQRCRGDTDVECSCGTGVRTQAQTSA